MHASNQHTAETHGATASMAFSEKLMGGQAREEKDVFVVNDGFAII